LSVYRGSNPDKDMGNGEDELREWGDVTLADPGIRARETSTVRPFAVTSRERVSGSWEANIKLSTWCPTTNINQKRRQSITCA
jgi:hypothetical protein